MLTKKEAAEFLGVSERAVERYTKAGRLNPTYQQNKSGGGSLALFKDADLSRLRDEMAAPKKRAASSQPDTPTRTDIARRDAVSGITDTREALVALLKSTSSPRASLSEKMLLSIDEAAELAGLSAHHIRGAIHSKKLKGRIVGKGWRIKPEELRAYVKKL